MIAMYGEKMNPPVYKMPSQAIILLRQKKTVIRQLRKQLVASHAFFPSIYQNFSLESGSQNSYNKDESAGKIVNFV